MSCNRATQEISNSEKLVIASLNAKKQTYRHTHTHTHTLLTKGEPKKKKYDYLESFLL